MVKYGFGKEKWTKPLYIEDIVYLFSNNL